MWWIFSAHVRPMVTIRRWVSSQCDLPGTEMRRAESSTATVNLLPSARLLLQLVLLPTPPSRLYLPSHPPTHPPIPPTPILPLPDLPPPCLFFSLFPAKRKMNAFCRDHSSPVISLSLWLAVKKHLNAHQQNNSHFHACLHSGSSH